MDNYDNFGIMRKSVNVSVRQAYKLGDTAVVIINTPSGDRVMLQVKLLPEGDGFAVEYIEQGT